jgi:hypothetical protein
MDRLNPQTRLRCLSPPTPLTNPVLAIRRSPTTHPNLTLFQARRGSQNPRVPRFRHGRELHAHENDLPSRHG